MSLKENHIGKELRQLNNLIRRRVDGSPTKRCIDDVTGTNGWIIGYIAQREDNVYQRDLEHEFGITRSTASKVLSLMEKKGLVERVGVPQDARLKRIVLTQKSLELAEMMNEDAEKIEACLTGGFSEAELSQLREYIIRMKENLKK